MAVLNDSIVQGDLRVIGNLYANISGKSTSAVSAEKAASATEALQDSYGTTINASSYKTKQTASSWTGGTTGKTITAIHQNANGEITAINTGNITFPTVNNATVTIQKNGQLVTSFKLNDSSATTANITVPTALSQITSAHTHATGDITNLTGITVAKAKDLENSAFYNHSGNIWSGVSATVQSEINNKIAGVYQIQGDAVWSAISANNDNKKNGYVYNITGGVDGNSKDRNNNVISIGDNVVYIASSNKASAGWDKLASTIDLSPYQTIAGMTAYSQTGHTHTISAITDLTAYSGSTAFTRAGNLTANSFSASAGSTLAALTTKSHVSVSGNVSATGNFSAKGNVIGAAMTATSNVSVSGNISAAGAISSKGNITTTGTLIGASAKITNISATTISGVTDVSATNIKADGLSANSLNLNGDASVNTLNANELVVDGAARVLGTLYADTIEGKISSATSANNADTLDGKHAADFVLSSDSRLTDSRTPKAHATSATTYGVGTTANYGHVKITNGDLSGATHTDGVVAGKAHTHGQYLTAHQSLANYVTTGTNQTITGTKTFSSNNFLEALRVSRNNSAGGAAIGLYPCKQTVTGWGINAGADGNLNIGTITNTTTLDTTSSLFVSANGTVKAKTFSGNLSGVARSANLADTATSATSSNWNNLINKPSFGTMTGANTSSYYLKTETSSKDQISTALNGKQVVGNYLSASYSSTTSCTFAGSAASAGVASTAKKATWNQKDDDRNYKVAISLDSEFDYDTPFEYNPASGKLTVPSATKIGGCTMTWNTGTSALDFTF